MKHFALETAAASFVSHNPELRKHVLCGEGAIAGLRHVSHIVLPVGATAVEHMHEGATEVFWCAGGEVRFVVNGEDVVLCGGGLLVVEPGDRHAIADTPVETVLLYFMTS